MHPRDGASMKLYVWERPGWENRYRTICGHRDADGALVVFDVTRPSTFEEIGSLRTALDTTTAPDGLGRRVPVFLLANKCDLLEEGAVWRTPVPREGMDDYCREHDFAGWFEISAKNQSHRPRVDAALNALLDQILLTSPPPDPECRAVLPSSSMAVVDSNATCWC